MTTPKRFESLLKRALCPFKDRGVSFSDGDPLWITNGALALHTGWLRAFTGADLPDKPAIQAYLAGLGIEITDKPVSQAVLDTYVSRKPSLFLDWTRVLIEDPEDKKRLYRMFRNSEGLHQWFNVNYVAFLGDLSTLQSDRLQGPFTNSDGNLVVLVVMPFGADDNGILGDLKWPKEDPKAGQE